MRLNCHELPLINPLAVVAYSIHKNVNVYTKTVVNWYTPIVPLNINFQLP